MASDERVRVPRSLADDLRGRSDAELAMLIRRRPDIADPVPSDLAELASRASSAASVRLAMENLDRRSIALLSVIAVAEQPVRLDTVTVAVDLPDQLLDVANQLWAAGLLWGQRPESLESKIHVTSAARERLKDEATLPIDLGARVVATEEVIDPHLIDSLAGQFAVASIAVVARLADLWSETPPLVLKSGGLSARDVTAASAHLQLDELQTVFWIETAGSAGLVGSDMHDPPRFAPAQNYDAWTTADFDAQWARIAQGWLSSDRDPNRYGTQNTENQRIAPLTDSMSVLGLARLRRAVLDALAAVEPGGVVSLSELDQELSERLPRVRPQVRERAVRSALAQGELLGAVTRGALTSLGRSLLEYVSANDLAVAVRPSMPAPTDEFLAQADLTLVVPGAPSAGLRQLLALVADLESTGGAAVYRVTPRSVARVLDTGRTPGDVIAELASRSATALPQPLEYLINDVARRHGIVRVGAADSYLRSEDEEVIAAALAHPRAAALGLTQLAPGVLVARASATKLLELVRDLGHAPVAEGAGTSVVASARVAHRAPDTRTSTQRNGFDETFVQALVRALRSAENGRHDGAVAADTKDSLPRMATAQSATVLRAAQLDGTPVWIGYADNAGSTSRRLIDVVAIDAGAISVFDHNAGRIRTLVMSRVTGVVAADAADVATAIGSNGAGDAK